MCDFGDSCEMKMLQADGTRASSLIGLGAVPFRRGLYCRLHLTSATTIYNRTEFLYRLRALSSGESFHGLDG